MGIDYTFRRNFECLFSKENKQEVNRLKQRKNELIFQQHIFDLEKTLLLNQEIIFKIIPTLELKEEEKKKLKNSVEKIYQFFNKKKENRQIIRNINSKILMNKQIIEEIKRRKDEIVFFHKDQIKNTETSVSKKDWAVKIFQQKFKEVEIFIQRESKTPENLERYGKWRTFTIIPFMKKNEELLKRKCYFEQETNKIKMKIIEIKKETTKLLDEKNITEEKKTDNINKENNKLNQIKKYFDNNLKLCEGGIELIKLKYNLLLANNAKKSSIPAFKSKNPVKNLDINLNLLEPGIVELEMNLKKVVENEDLKFGEKDKKHKFDIDMNKINDKFEKEIRKEKTENNLKGNEVKPPENDNWGDFNDSGELSDIENKN